MAPTLGAILQILFISVIALLANDDKSPQLVIIMLDGVRWDYLDLLPTKDLGGFTHFKETGVRTEYVETVFPSVSLPAWTTLQTGLFPDNHNILGNRMYDRSSKLEMNTSTVQLPMWWQKSEPIWITATRQGLRAATIDWNHAEVPFEGWLPEVANGYMVSDRTFSHRIQEVIWRLRRGFDLVMMYYPTIDTLGHTYGPASMPVMTELCRVGREMNRLFKYIQDGDKEERVHLIVVSDHGMAPACMLPETNLSYYIDVKKMTENVVCDMGTIMIYAKDGCHKEVYSRLKSVPGFITKMRDDIPDEFHFKGAERAPDVVLYKDPQWRPPRRRCVQVQGGAHGFDPLREPTMRGVFMAWGAAFIGDGLVHPPLRLVDIYQLYAHVLRFTPRPHNGSWSAVRQLLRCGRRSYVPMTDADAEDDEDADEGLHNRAVRRLLETRPASYLWRSHNWLLLVNLLTFLVAFILTSNVIIPQTAFAECQLAASAAPSAGAGARAKGGEGAEAEGLEPGQGEPAPAQLPAQGAPRPADLDFPTHTSCGCAHAQGPQGQAHPAGPCLADGIARAPSGGGGVLDLSLSSHNRAEESLVAGAASDRVFAATEDRLVTSPPSEGYVVPSLMTESISTNRGPTEGHAATVPLTESNLAVSHESLSHSFLSHGSTGHSVTSQVTAGRTATNPVTARAATNGVTADHVLTAGLATDHAISSSMRTGYSITSIMTAGHGAKGSVEENRSSERHPIKGHAITEPVSEDVSVAGSPVSVKYVADGAEGVAVSASGDSQPEPVFKNDHTLLSALELKAELIKQNIKKGGEPNESDRVNVRSGQRIVVPNVDLHIPGAKKLKDKHDTSTATSLRNSENTYSINNDPQPITINILIPKSEKQITKNERANCKYAGKQKSFSKPMKHGAADKSRNILRNSQPIHSLHLSNKDLEVPLLKKLRPPCACKNFTFDVVYGGQKENCSRRSDNGLKNSASTGQKCAGNKMSSPPKSASRSGCSCSLPNDLATSPTASPGNVGSSSPKVSKQPPGCSAIHCMCEVLKILPIKEANSSVSKSRCNDPIALEKQAPKETRASQNRATNMIVNQREYSEETLSTPSWLQFSVGRIIKKPSALSHQTQNRAVSKEKEEKHVNNVHSERNKNVGYLELRSIKDQGMQGTEEEKIIKAATDGEGFKSDIRKKLIHLQPQDQKYMKAKPDNAFYNIFAGTTEKKVNEEREKSMAGNYNAELLSNNFPATVGTGEKHRCTQAGSKTSQQLESREETQEVEGTKPILIKIEAIVEKDSSHSNETKPAQQKGNKSEEKSKSCSGTQINVKSDSKNEDATSDQTSHFIDSDPKKEPPIVNNVNSSSVSGRAGSVLFKIFVTDGISNPMGSPTILNTMSENEDPSITTASSKHQDDTSNNDVKDVKRSVRWFSKRKHLFSTTTPISSDTMSDTGTSLKPNEDVNRISGANSGEIKGRMELLHSVKSSFPRGKMVHKNVEKVAELRNENIFKQNGNKVSFSDDKCSENDGDIPEDKFEVTVSIKPLSHSTIENNIEEEHELTEIDDHNKNKGRKEHAESSFRKTLDPISISSSKGTQHHYTHHVSPEGYDLSTGSVDSAASDQSNTAYFNRKGRNVLSIDVDMLNNGVGGKVDILRRFKIDTTLHDQVGTASLQESKRNLEISKTLEEDAEVKGEEILQGADVSKKVFPGGLMDYEDDSVILTHRAEVLGARRTTSDALAQVSESEEYRERPEDVLSHTKEGAREATVTPPAAAKATEAKATTASVAAERQRAAALRVKWLRGRARESSGSEDQEVPLGLCKGADTAELPEEKLEREAYVKRRQEFTRQWERHFAARRAKLAASGTAPEQAESVPWVPHPSASHQHHRCW